MLVLSGEAQALRPHGQRAGAGSWPAQAPRLPVAAGPRRCAAPACALLTQPPQAAPAAAAAGGQRSSGWPPAPAGSRRAGPPQSWRWRPRAPRARWAPAPGGAAGGGQAGGPARSGGCRQPVQALPGKRGGLQARVGSAAGCRCRCCRPGDTLPALRRRCSCHQPRPHPAATWLYALSPLVASQPRQRHQTAALAIINIKHSNRPPAPTWMYGYVLAPARSPISIESHWL